MASRPSRSTAGMIESTKAIIAHLTRLRRPAAQLLQPGLSRERIEECEASLPFRLTRDLVALYRFKNGTAPRKGDLLEDLWFFPGYYWLSLEEAVTDYRDRRRSRQWKKGWFPVFSDGAGGYYVVSCDPADPPGIIGFISGEPEQDVEYLSLPVMFETLAKCFTGGAFFVKKKDFDIDDDKHRRIAIKLNPGLDFWTKEEEQEEEGLRRGEAVKLAKEATKVMKKKATVFKALGMFEKALEVPDLPKWAYVNGLWAVMSGNNHHPLDPPRIRKMLAICLPQSRGVPDMFVNAAFAYVELGEVDQVIDCFRKAKSRGVDLNAYLADPALAPLANDKRFVALKRASEKKTK